MRYIMNAVVAVGTHIRLFLVWTRPTAAISWQVHELLIELYTANYYLLLWLFVLNCFFIDSLLLLFQLHHLFEDSKEILVCINGFVLCITFVYFKMRQKNSNFTSQKQVSLLTANILQNSQTYYTIHLHPEEWTGMRNFCCNESLSLTKLPAVEI